MNKEKQETKKGESHDAFTQFFGARCLIWFGGTIFTSPADTCGDTAVARITLS